MKLHEKMTFKGTLKCITGLHIGDSKDNTDIGGVDLPVVRRKDNSQPYIPGSSIKGKMRCLLEQVAGENADAKFLHNGKEICLLMGGLENKSTGQPQQPSRLIVRDAFMEKKSAELFSTLNTTDMPYTEVKFENTINRVTGTAKDPRQLERVPAGAIFDVEFMINVFAKNDATEEELDKIKKGLTSTLERGVNLINDDYLGGSGSRGYGQVQIEINWKGVNVKKYGN
jgi:CRISPR-associated protein Csm3